MNVVGPFPASDVAARLKAKVPLAKLFGTAADLDAALENPPNASPALYVLVEERGGTEKYSGPMTVQNADVQVKVVLLVRNVTGERLGTGARQKADEVIAQLRAALIGWSPSPDFNALTFSAGRDDRYRAGWYAGQQIFRSDYRIQNQVMP